MKKIFIIAGIVFFASFVVRTYTYFASGSVSQKDYAEELVIEEIKNNKEIDKYKILKVSNDIEKYIINGTVMGLPQDKVTLLEVEVKVKETTIYGIETEEHYNHDFFKLDGNDDWQYGRKVSSEISGTQQYKLEDY